VHLLRIGGRAVQRDAEVLADLPELAEDVLPLADAQVVEVLLLAQPAELVARQLLLPLPYVLPQVEVRQEVRLLVGEPRVLLVGRLPFVGRAFARVLDRQRGGDDHDLAYAAVPVRLQHHPGEARVDRQLSQLAAERSEASRRQGAELLQEVHAVLDVAPVGRVDEREVEDVAQAQVGHLQDDRGEVGAQDLRVGELRAGEEVLLGVEPDAHALRHPAAAALALVGRGLGHRLDRQPLHLRPVAVARDAGSAGVDDVLDARHRQRGLRDIGGEHDPPASVGLEHPVLLGRGQPGVQRQDLGVPQLLLLQSVRGVADLPLAGQEDQHVAGRFEGEFVDRVEDRLRLVVVLLKRPVAHLDRVRTAGHLDDRRVREVPGEPLRVDRGRGDDHLEVGPPGEQALDVAEDEVDVQAALVGLIDDQRVVAAEHTVARELVQQDAVGHDLDQRRVAGVVGEPHLVADGLAEWGVQLLGDALGDRTGGQPARLRVPDQALHAQPQLEADLRQLRGLAGPGLPGDDHDLVLLDGVADLVLAPADRQRLRIADGGHRRAAQRDALLGGLDVGGDLRDGVVTCGGVAYAADAVETAAQPMLVAQHQLGQP
jgi:hypothetical protein